MNQSNPNINIEAIYISPGHDFYGRYGMDRNNHGIQLLETVHCVAGSGLEGDRFFDYKEDFKGQATFFSAEVADALRGHFEDVFFENSAFRRNLITRGVDLNALIGRRFKVGDVEFEGTEESAPCEWMDEAVGPGAREFLEGNGGLRVRIMTSGTLCIGLINLDILE
tara:strand:- start:1681 stop:2181 length:501 start_codon:yes stop_codon:yes gene_type:complete